MPANLTDLINSSSQLAEEVLAFLAWTSKQTAQVPYWYPNRLKSLEPGVDRFVDIRQTMQVHDRSAYSEWLVKEQERPRAAGYQDIDNIAYKDRQSRFDHGGGEPRSVETEHAQEAAKPEPFFWDEQARHRYPRAIILGDPGMGKTYFLRAEARQIAETYKARLQTQILSLDDVVLPIYLRLSALALAKYSNWPLEMRLYAHIDEHYGFQTYDRQLAFQRFFDNQLATGKIALYLDALDEVSAERRIELRQILSRFAERYQQAGILISSRLVGYEGNMFANDVHELELLTFQQHQIEKFTQVWFGNSAKGENLQQAFTSNLTVRPTISGLARIPLMLTLMARAFQSQPHNLPSRRVELYDLCLKGLLIDWQPPDQPSRTPVYIDALLRLLASVAFELWEREKEQFTALELANIMYGVWDQFKQSNEPAKQRVVTELNEFRAGDVIDELIKSGLIVTATVGGSVVETQLIFIHRTFQEYLVACELATRIEPMVAPISDVTSKKNKSEHWLKIAPYISRKAWLPEWQEIIVLLAGLLTDPGPMLEMLGDAKPNQVNRYGDDIFRHRLVLACLCLSEYPESVVLNNQRIIDHLTTESMNLCWQNLPEYADITNIEVTFLHNYNFIQALPFMESLNGKWNNFSLYEGLLRLLIEPPLTHNSYSYDTTTCRKALTFLTVISENTVSNRSLLGNIFSLIINDKVYNAERDRFAFTIGRLYNQEQSEFILNQLTLALKSEEFGARRVAILAVKEIAENNPIPYNLIKLLLNSLTDNDCGCRSYAAKALNSIFKFSSKKQQDELRKACSQVLQHKITLISESNIDNQSLTFEFFELLKDLNAVAAYRPIFILLVDFFSNTMYGAVAAKTLVELGKKQMDDDVIEIMISNIYSPNFDIRENSFRALVGLGSIAARESLISEIPKLLKKHVTFEMAVCFIKSFGFSAATNEIINEIFYWMDTGKIYKRGLSGAIIALYISAREIELRYSLESRIVSMLLDTDILLKINMFNEISNFQYIPGTPAIAEALYQNICFCKEIDNEDLMKDMINAVGKLRGGEELKPYISKYIDELFYFPDYKYDLCLAIKKLGEIAATDRALLFLSNCLYVGGEATIPAIEAIGALCSDNLDYRELSQIMKIFNSLDKGFDKKRVKDVLTILMNNHHRIFNDPKVPSLYFGLKTDKLSKLCNLSM